MKKILLVCFLFSGILANAQTNTNTSTSLLPGGLGVIAGDTLKWFTDSQAYFGTNGLRIGAYGLYNQAKWGSFIDAQYPINNNLSAGFGLAYLDHTWYDVSLGINIGTTWNVPLIGHIYTWAESGPGYNAHSHSAISQSFVGATKDISIKDWHIFASGGAGVISDRPGQTYIAGFSVKPPGLW